MGTVWFVTLRIMSRLTVAPRLTIISSLKRPLSPSVTFKSSNKRNTKPDIKSRRRIPSSYCFVSRSVSSRRMESTPSFKVFSSVYICEAEVKYSRVLMCRQDDLIRSSQPASSRPLFAHWRSSPKFYVVLFGMAVGSSFHQRMSFSIFLSSGLMILSPTSILSRVVTPYSIGTMTRHRR